MSRRSSSVSTTTTHRTTDQLTDQLTNQPKFEVQALQDANKTMSKTSLNESDLNERISDKNHVINDYSQFKENHKENQLVLISCVKFKSNLKSTLP